jgi:hypothetical protein
MISATTPKRSRSFRIFRFFLVVSRCSIVVHSTYMSRSGR